MREREWERENEREWERENERERMSERERTLSRCKIFNEEHTATKYD